MDFSNLVWCALILCIEILFGITNSQISSILTELSACLTSVAGYYHFMFFCCFLFVFFCCCCLFVFFFFSSKNRVWHFLQICMYVNLYFLVKEKKKVRWQLTRNCARTLYLILQETWFWYLFALPHWGNSNKNPKQFWVTKNKQGLSYKTFWSLKFLYNSKLILMPISFGTNAIFATRPHCNIFILLVMSCQHR